MTCAPVGLECSLVLPLLGTRASDNCPQPMRSNRLPNVEFSNACTCRRESTLYHGFRGSSLNVYPQLAPPEARTYCTYMRTVVFWGYCNKTAILCCTSSGLRYSAKTCSAQDLRKDTLEVSPRSLGCQTVLVPAAVS